MLIAAAALMFAPPLDTPLVYETVEHHPTPAGERVYKMRLEATFARDGDGYRLTLHTLDADAAAPAAQRDQFAAAMAEAGKVPVRIHLSRDGVPDHVIDAAATWAAFVGAIRGVAAGTPPDPMAAAYAGKLAALPPEARDAQLLENADTVVSPHLAPLRPGQVIADGGATISREPDEGGESRFHRASERPGPNGGRITVDEDIAIAPATGLVSRIVRTVHVTAPELTAAVELSHAEIRMVK